MGELINAIPSFFYDFICRVIPGALALHLVAYSKCCEQNSTFGNFALVVAMWAVGITLDVFSEHIGRYFVSFFTPKPPDDSKSTPVRWGVSLRTFTGPIFKLDSEWRAALARAVAYRSFFRSLVVVGLLALSLNIFGDWLKTFDTFKWIQMPSWIQTTSPVLFLVLIVVFFLCWLLRGVELNNQLKLATEWLSGDEHKGKQKKD